MKDIIYKLPIEFLEKLKEIYPTSYPRICETFLRKGEHTFRANYLKTDLIRLREALNGAGVKYRELPWPRGTFILKSDMRELQKTELYKDGLIYVQNVSSMIPPIVLNSQRGEKILDLCAAPGAKTTQIASLAGKEIELVAVEKIKVRYYKLLANLEVQGVDFAKVHLMDGSWPRKEFSEYFDKVLVDVPCSVEGRFDVNEPDTYKYWKGRKVKEMAHKQKKLLYSAISSLRNGGEMVYSTCTFSPEENEEVVDWALSKFDNIEIMPITLPISNLMTGLIKWRGKNFSPKLRLSLRILPNDFMEGFFIAKFKKIK